jgi:hypothetical protein
MTHLNDLEPTNKEIFHWPEIKASARITLKSPNLLLSSVFFGCLLCPPSLFRLYYRCFVLTCSDYVVYAEGKQWLRGRRLDDEIEESS